MMHSSMCSGPCSTDPPTQPRDSSPWWMSRSIQQWAPPSIRRSTPQATKTSRARRHRVVRSHTTMLQLRLRLRLSSSACIALAGTVEPARQLAADPVAARGRTALTRGCGRTTEYQRTRRRAAVRSCTPKTAGRVAESPPCGQRDNRRPPWRAHPRTADLAYRHRAPLRHPGTDSSRTSTCGPRVSSRRSRFGSRELRTHSRRQVDRRHICRRTAQS